MDMERFNGSCLGDAAARTAEKIFRVTHSRANAPKGVPLRPSYSRIAFIKPSIPSCSRSSSSAPTRK